MHIPVLKREVIEHLNPKPNENFVDCTINGGGHSLAILERTKPNGKILGIDWDEEIIKQFEKRINKSWLKSRLILACENFVYLERIIENRNFGPVSGILFDLGMSKIHLKESGRGFSFQKDEPLIMRYSQQEGELTAEKIINEWPKKEIARVLKECGEERFAERIAREIIGTRQNERIKTTHQLVEIVRKATPLAYHRRKIHPATRTFQALRIAVNRELVNLKKALPQALRILKPEGRLVIISFHSLEDRIVKQFFKKRARQKVIDIITKKPIRASEEETKTNPSSRSARLRAAIKII